MERVVLNKHFEVLKKQRFVALCQIPILFFFYHILWLVKPQTCSVAAQQEAEMQDETAVNSLKGLLSFLAIS